MNLGGSLLSRRQSSRLETAMLGASALSNYALDRLIAPDLSKIERCEAENIQYNGDDLANLLLNYVFRVGLNGTDISVPINFVWRVDQATKEYNLARDVLLTLCQRKNYAPTLYYDCLNHFLQSVGLLYQSMVLQNSFVNHVTKSKNKIYIQGQQSREERLNDIYRAWKHGDERILRGELPEGGSLAVWLVPSGLRTAKICLQYSELRAMLVESLQTARWYSQDLPNRILERQQEHGEPMDDGPDLDRGN